jgi:co-chaperonin GroES (HSP10)|tara:strand:- start:978 stop:1421 length:444 start_codon:yes stop_codon:yes gene_type:complete
MNTEPVENSAVAKKIAEAYVDPSDIVLDPEKLDASILERMPQPTGWRMLVLPYAGKAKTKGGIVLTKDTKDREALASIVAYVVKKGPLCYNDKGRYGDKHWCEEKQWVLIGRYSGSRFKLEDGAEVRIINDDEVIATILNPDDIVSL